MRVAISASFISLYTPDWVALSHRHQQQSKDYKRQSNRAETAEFPHHLDDITFLNYSGNKEPALGAEFTEPERQTEGKQGRAGAKQSRYFI